MSTTSLRRCGSTVFQFAIQRKATTTYISSPVSQRYLSLLILQSSSHQWPLSNKQQQFLQRHRFGSRRRRPPPKGGDGNKSKAAKPTPQFFEIDEDEDDGEQWKKILGEYGDEWDEVEFDGEEAEYVDVSDDDDDDDIESDAAGDSKKVEAVKKFLESTREAARRRVSRYRQSSSNEQPLSSSPTTTTTPKEENHRYHHHTHSTRIHSLNPRLSAVISAGFPKLNGTAKHMMTTTQSTPLLRGENQYVRGRPSNAQLSMAFQLQEIIQDYLADLVNVRYDTTFCLPGTYKTIEIRAVETSPDLHLARVHWSLPSDCQSELPDSLQVKLIHHMQDVVFQKKQGRRKLQRLVHTKLGYLRNPPKISMVWWDDGADEFDYGFGGGDDDDDSDDDEDFVQQHQRNKKQASEAPRSQQQNEDPKAAG